MVTSAAPIRTQPQKRSIRPSLQIVAPSFARETLRNPRSGFTKFPNQESDMILMADIPDAARCLLLYLNRHTRGGSFPGAVESEREHDRPRCIGPRIERGDNGQETIIGIRERLAKDLGFSIPTIDKSIQALRGEDWKNSGAETRVIELRRSDNAPEDSSGNDFWLIYRPENLGTLPRRKYEPQNDRAPKMPPGTADEIDSAGDETLKLAPGKLAPVKVGALRKTKWQTCGGLKLRFDNHRSDDVEIAAEVEEEGITIILPEVIADSQPEPVGSRNPLQHLGGLKQAAGNGTSRKELRHLVECNAENTPLARSFDALPAASKASFDTLLQVLDRVGIVTTYDECQLMQTHFCQYPPAEHIEIAADACAREGVVWNGPQWADRGPKYLDPKGKRLWKSAPIKRPTTTNGRKRGLEYTEAELEELDKRPIPGMRRRP